jgi:hypothetical protein
MKVVLLFGGGSGAYQRTSVGTTIARVLNLHDAGASAFRTAGQVNLFGADDDRSHDR